MPETDNSNIEKRLEQFDQAEKHFENILAALEEYRRLIVDVASYLGLHSLRDIRSRTM
jgi:F0F1-type ATP synthase membrane subunit b/b'